jgi:hypothetical protein
MPRWGFPPVAWRRLVTPAGGPSPVTSIDRFHASTRAASGALWTLAVVAVLLTGAEVWRYALVLISRNRMSTEWTLALSDISVLGLGIVASVVSVLTVAFTLMWVFRARDLADELTRTRGHRSRFQVYCALFVPVLNALLAGVVLTELEHTALRDPPNRRPRPSGLLLCWWVVWVAGLVFGGWVLVLAWVGDAQAKADGIVIHALVDLTAAVLAVLTIRFIDRIAGLLAPVQPGRRMYYVPRPTGAPAVPRSTPEARSSANVAET